MRAIRRAVDGDFAAGAAANGADGLALGWAKTIGFALFADWTRHYELPECNAIKQNTLAEGRFKVERCAVFAKQRIRECFLLLYVASVEVLTFLACATDFSLSFP